MICPHPAVLNSAAMIAPTPQPHHKRQSRAAGSCSGPNIVGSDNAKKRRVLDSVPANVKGKNWGVCRMTA